MVDQSPDVAAEVVPVHGVAQQARVQGVARAVVDRVGGPDAADAEGWAQSGGVKEQVVEEGLVAFFGGGDAVREDEG